MAWVRRPVSIAAGLVAVLLVGVAIGVLIGRQWANTGSNVTAATTTTAVAESIDRQSVIDACTQHSGPGAASACPVLVDTVLGIAARLGYPCTTAQITGFVVDDINSRFAADQITTALSAACGL